VTILEVIQRSADYLAKRGVDSPRLQVELLLAHVLDLPRMKLYLNFERILTPAELETLRALVQRRGLREPLQYIVGGVSFCGLELAVNRSVLIPRPETELLAELAWKFLKTFPEDGAPRHALDICTGSACLAVAIAAHVPAVLVWAADISGEALVVARQNIERHHFSSRVSICQGDMFDAIDSQSKFDLIVSNPPYIPDAEVDKLEPELREFEPRSALAGGEDGLDFIRRIAGDAARFLKPGGRVMVELEEDGAKAAQIIFASSNWIVEPLELDYNRKPRILIARAAD
jgi:release factor glutamine methyltransferase